MAPLKKLGSTLHKLSDKFTSANKRRISEDGEAAQQAKQPKTLPPSPQGQQSDLGPRKVSQPTIPQIPTSTTLTNFHPVGLEMGSTSSSQHSATAHGGSQSRTPSSASSMQKDPSARYGSTPDDPIDLTSSPLGSPMSQFTDSSSLNLWLSGMDQIEMDEQVARRLQEYLNNNSAEANTYCSEPWDFDPRTYGAYLTTLKCAQCQAYMAFNLEKMGSWTEKSLYSDPSVAPSPKLGDRLLRRGMRPRSTSEPDPSSAQPASSHSHPVPPNAYAIAGGYTPTAAAQAAMQKKLTKHRPKMSQLSKGIGYGGPDYFAGRSPGDFLGLGTKAKPKPTFSREDKEAEKYYAALSVLLPSRTRYQPSQFDFEESQPAVAFMLARSPLMQKASEILRQTSIEEMTASRSLYSALMDFLAAMTRHPSALLHLLFTNLVLYSEAEQLGPLTFWTPERTAGSSQGAEKTEPLNRLLETLADTCRYYLHAASAHVDELKTNDEAGALELANKIISTASGIQETRKRSRSSFFGDNSTSLQPIAQSSTVMTRSRSAMSAAKEAKGEAQAWHREHCVKDLPDEVILKSFHFASKARGMANTNMPRTRMKKLLTQVSSLRSDLPEGIFVRHGASRLDIMKVLIVGPEDTPYENGLFEFDLFCDQYFPEKPPQMQFRTTSGGRVHFNPNLYANGKVCLSLLGTWSGQNWVPNQSTILQVLVSIQGMILCSQPWYNEPGREAHLDEAGSKQYNRTIFGHTIATAMIGWLNERLSQPDKGEAGSSDKGKGKDPASTPKKSPASTASKLVAASPVTEAFPNTSAPPLPHPSTAWMGSPYYIDSDGNEWKPVFSASPHMPYSYGPSAQPPVPGSPSASSTKADASKAKNGPPAATITIPTFMKNAPPPLAQKYQDFFVKLQSKSVDDYVTPPQSLGTPPGVPFWSSPWDHTTEGAPPFGHIEGDGSGLFLFPVSHWPGMLYDAPPLLPIGNTLVDGKDDEVWGEVIRHHFERRGQLILVKAKKSPYQPDKTTLKALEDALKRMGFME
ncbi:hypothetical protein OQA88_10809 [Cercophora sp. LCS_1]